MVIKGLGHWAWSTPPRCTQDLVNPPLAAAHAELGTRTSEPPHIMQGTNATATGKPILIPVALGANLNHCSPKEGLGYLLGCKRGLPLTFGHSQLPLSFTGTRFNGVTTRGENGITGSHISGSGLAV